MSDFKEKKSPKKSGTDEVAHSKLPTSEVTTLTISHALKKMRPDLARQVVLSAVSQNLTVFVSAFTTACEIMWVNDLLVSLDQPAALRKAGYSAKDLCLLITERGYLLDKKIFDKAKEIDILHNLDTYSNQGLDTESLMDLDKEKSSS